MDATTVRPSALASSESAATTLSAWNESSPEVGSSAKSTAGEPTSSQAIESRLRSPPLSPRALPPPTRASATFARPSLRIRAPAVAEICASGVPSSARRRAASSSVSRTVSIEKNSSDCCTKATRGGERAAVAFRLLCRRRVPPPPSSTGRARRRSPSPAGPGPSPAARPGRAAASSCPRPRGP